MASTSEAIRREEIKTGRPWRAARPPVGSRERLMEKYGKPNSIRPKHFFPRLDVITVYGLTVERMTGKEQLLPELSEQWPAKDQTRTPYARP
jgi:hypothetical protein